MKGEGGRRSGREGKGSINFMQRVNYQQYILVTTMGRERGGGREGGFTDLFFNNISQGSVLFI